MVRSFLLMLLVMATLSPESAGQSIDFSKNAPSQWDVAARQKNCLRAIFRFYDECTKDPESIQPRAKAFLERYARDFAFFKFTLIDPVEINEMIREGEQILAAGSNDPLVNRTLAYLYFEENRDNDALDHSYASILEFEESSYPPGLINLALQQMMRPVSRRVNNPFNRHEWIRIKFSKNISNWFHFWQHESGLPWDATTKRFAIEMHLMYRDCVNSPSLYLKGLRAYADQPDSDPFVAAYLEGHRLFHYRGFYTGGQGSPDPNRPSELGYQESRKLAVKNYEEAYAIEPTVVQVPFQLMVASEQGLTDHPSSYWFQRCIDVQVDFPPALQRYRQVLSPSRNKTHEALLDDAKQFLESERFDSAAPSVYQNVFAQIEQSLGKDNLFFERLDVYENLCYYLDEKIAHALPKSDHGLTAIQVYSLAAKLRYAMKFKQYQDAKQLWFELDKYTDHFVFNLVPLDAFHDRSFTHAVVEFSDKLTSLMQAEEDFEPTTDATANAESKRRMMNAWQELSQASSDPDSQPFLKSRIEVAEKEIHYWNNEPVMLDCKPGLGAWTGSLSDFSANPDGSIRLSSLKDFNSKLVHRGKFPGPKRIQLEIVSEKREKDFLPFGIRIGTTSFKAEDKSFAIDFQKQKIYHTKLKTSYPVKPINTYARSIDVRLWGPRRIEFRVDGVMDNDTTDPKFKMTSPRVGLGIPGNYRHSGQVVARNFIVTRLTQDPPPDRWSYDLLTQRDEYLNDLVAYYKNQTSQNPTDHEYWHLLGDAYFESEQWAEAFAAYQKALKLNDLRFRTRQSAAMVLFRMERYAESFQEFDRAMEVGRGLRGALMKMMADYGYYLCVVPDPKFRNVNKASRILKRATSGHGRLFTVAWAAHANAQAALGNLEEAKALFAKGQQLNNTPAVFSQRVQRIGDAIANDTFESIDLPADLPEFNFHQPVW